MSQHNHADAPDSMDSSRGFSSRKVRGGANFGKSGSHGRQGKDRRRGESGRKSIDFPSNRHSPSAPRPNSEELKISLKEDVPLSCSQASNNSGHASKEILAASLSEPSPLNSADEGNGYEIDHGKRDPYESLLEHGPKRLSPIPHRIDSTPPLVSQMEPNATSVSKVHVQLSDPTESMERDEDGEGGSIVLHSSLSSEGEDASVPQTSLGLPPTLLPLEGAFPEGGRHRLVMWLTYDRLCGSLLASHINLERALRQVTELRLKWSGIADGCASETDTLPTDAVMPLPRKLYLLFPSIRGNPFDYSDFLKFFESRNDSDEALVIIGYSGHTRSRRGESHETDTFFSCTTFCRTVQETYATRVCTLEEQSDFVDDVILSLRSLSPTSKIGIIAHGLGAMTFLDQIRRGRHESSGAFDSVIWIDAVVSRPDALCGAVDRLVTSSYTRKVTALGLHLACYAGRGLHQSFSYASSMPILQDTRLGAGLARVMHACVNSRPARGWCEMMKDHPTQIAATLSLCHDMTAGLNSLDEFSDASLIDKRYYPRPTQWFDFLKKTPLYLIHTTSQVGQKHAERLKQSLTEYALAGKAIQKQSAPRGPDERPQAVHIIVSPDAHKKDAPLLPRWVVSFCPEWGINMLKRFRNATYIGITSESSHAILTDLQSRGIISP